MLNPFHLLVIDDQLSELLLLSEVLEGRPDVRVTLITSVTDLLRTMPSGDLPHLILLDLHLGADSGLDTLRTLKAHPVTRRVPVVIFSGSDNPADVGAAYDEHAAGFLVKPLLFTDLTATVEHLIDFWRGTRTPDHSPPGHQPA